MFIIVGQYIKICIDLEGVIDDFSGGIVFVVDGCYSYFVIGEYFGGCINGLCDCFVLFFEKCGCFIGFGQFDGVVGCCEFQDMKMGVGVVCQFNCMMGGKIVIGKVVVGQQDVLIYLVVFFLLCLEVGIIYVIFLGENVVENY